MLKGIKLRAYPTLVQKDTIDHWIGCAKKIWNAKCEDERYMTIFARKYCTVGTYAPIDQTYSQYKNKTLTPYLYDCPSQILRNSTVSWYQTYKNFMRGICGKPRRKKKGVSCSIHLTRELFHFVICSDGNVRLFIGSKTKNIGFLNIKMHRKFKFPNSIYLSRKNGEYYVSFCYGEAGQQNLDFNKANLTWLQDKSEDYLQQYTIGIDRGIAIPVYAGNKSYDFTKEQKKSKKRREKYLKRAQKGLARKKQGSKRYKKAKSKISNHHAKIANIRDDFCHKVSHEIVANPHNKIIVLEDLRTKNMTKRPAKKIKTQDKNTGKTIYAKNHALAKAGLNKAILDKGWHRLEKYLQYKSQLAGKAFFKVSAHYTSQACSACDYTHPDNRQTQANFVCQSCGYSDNADSNAANVIKKRAIKLLKHSGTELSKRGVLTSNLDIGRGVEDKTTHGSATVAPDLEASKKKVSTTNVLV